jgi:tripartite ATP-independent transporter DctP family solute receptor
MELKAEGPIALRAAQILPANHPSQLALIRMGELLKEKSKGEIVLELVDNSGFEGERDLIEAIQMGELELIVIATPPLYGFTTDFLLFDLPYIFPDVKTARTVLDGPIGKRSLKNTMHVGLMGLTYYENGLSHISSDTKPILLPEDLKGMRIRTMESRIQMVTFRSLGATAVPLAYHDLIRYLKKDSIDLQENSVQVMYTSEIYKIQKYYTFTGHFYKPSPMFISYAVWSRLSEEHRAIILEAAEESSVYQKELCDEMNSPSTLAELEKYMILFQHPDLEAWKKALEPVHKEFLPEIGANSLKELSEEVRRIQASRGDNT